MSRDEKLLALEQEREALRRLSRYLCFVCSLFGAGVILAPWPVAAGLWIIAIGAMPIFARRRCSR
jgi:hypothetical protein